MPDARAGRRPSRRSWRPPCRPAWTIPTRPRTSSVTHIAPGLSYVLGRNVSSNTIVVDTSAGAVIIDTSRPPASRAHFDLLQKDGVTKAAYVILTHGHGDHTGGVALWKGAGAKVVAQENFTEFLQYQRMLGGFFARTEQRAVPVRRQARRRSRGPPSGVAARRERAAHRARCHVRQTRLCSMPATRASNCPHAGRDAGPPHRLGSQLKAVFLGDNFYKSFPNMYTLRGTRRAGRWTTSRRWRK